MEENIKRRFALAVSEKEFPLLEIVHRKGPCTAEEVQGNLKDGAGLLDVMRSLHDLMDRGLLEGMMINKQRLYRVKSSYKEIRSRLITTESL
jgi:hypothetical protein